MEGFIDLYLPERIIGFDFTASPRMSTTIGVAGLGVEQRNRNWVKPLNRFASPACIRCHDDIEDLRDHWMITDGPHLSFPFRNPFDFASVRLQKAGLVPTLSPVDQVLGEGDGVETTFSFQKTYTRGAFERSHAIALPVESTVRVALNAVEVFSPASFSIDREAGTLTFTAPPGVGVVVTAGYLYDVPVRFEGDDLFEQVLRAYQTDGFAGLSLFEIRPC